MGRELTRRTAANRSVSLESDAHLIEQNVFVKCLGRLLGSGKPPEGVTKVLNVIRCKGGLVAEERSAQIRVLSAKIRVHAFGRGEQLRKGADTTDTACQRFQRPSGFSRQSQEPGREFPRIGAANRSVCAQGSGH
jgi:hypothetical protein